MSISKKDDEQESEKYKMYYHTVIDFPKDDIQPTRTMTGQNQRKKKMEERQIKSSQQIHRRPSMTKSGSKKDEKSEGEGQTLKGQTLTHTYIQTHTTRGLL